MNISFCYEINNSDECLSIYFDTLDENLLVIIKNDDTYILDKDKTLNNLGMEVEYTGVNVPENAILGTELFYCVLK